MKSFKQFAKVNENTPLELFQDVIDAMVSQPGYQGHEIQGDEIVFSFDSDGAAEVAYNLIDAESEVDYEDDDMEDYDTDEEGLDDDDDDEYVDMDDTYSSDITEAKIVIKVNSKGQKKRRIKHKKGYKVVGNKQVPITGKEKANKRLAIRKSVRSKKAKGAGYQKKVNRRRVKALKKRSAMGL